ncbi:MAG TPA: PTS mannose transporter subunit IIA [Proteobacteria bacterium]|nr:PTS mannose transporter subunit IIA [Pseudomonadota bacterium]
MKLRLEQRIFLRSLCWQTSWNFAGMQCLGLAYAIYPLLENRYGHDRELLIRRVRRYLVCFNTNPYLGAAILGFLAHMEGQGEEMGDQGLALSGSLAGLYGAVGDAFFWNGLKPMVCTLAVLLYFLAPGLLAPLFLILIYNVVHLGLRYAVFLHGLHRGIGVIEVIDGWHLPRLRNAMEVLTSAGLAVIVYLLAIHFGFVRVTAPFLLFLLLLSGFYWWRKKNSGMGCRLREIIPVGALFVLAAILLDGVN